MLKGRKRHIVVETLGLLLAVVVTGAAVGDGTRAPQVLERLSRESLPRLKKLWADNQYHNHALNRRVSDHGWYVIEVVSRPPGERKFTVVKWRWVVERTFAWLGRCRIHSREYEREPVSKRGAGADQHDPADASEARGGEVHSSFPLSTPSD